MAQTAWLLGSVSRRLPRVELAGTLLRNVLGAAVMGAAVWPLRDGIERAEGPTQAIRMAAVVGLGMAVHGGLERMLRRRPEEPESPEMPP